MKVTRPMLEQLFRLKGGGGEKTRLFADLSASTQADLTRMAGFAPEEEPAIACFGDPSEWLVVTTRRLIWRQEESRGAIDLAELDRVDRDIRSAMARRLSAPESTAASVKALIDRLQIRARDGRGATLTLEPGRAFVTLSGVLVSLCHRAHDWRQGRRW